VQYIEAIARARIVANTTGRSVFVVGWLDHFAVLSHEPKALVGRNCYEVRPQPPSASSAGLSSSDVDARFPNGSTRGGYNLNRV
jgi:hypothetical protein